VFDNEVILPSGQEITYTKIELRDFVSVIPLVSVVSTYITIQQYNYGFTDILLFTGITAFILSIMSGILIFTSKAEFT
jgi:hypothetical protein